METEDSGCGIDGGEAFDYIAKLQCKCILQFLSPAFQFHISTSELLLAPLPDWIGSEDDPNFLRGDDDNIFWDMDELMK